MKIPSDAYKKVLFFFCIVLMIFSMVFLTGCAATNRIIFEDVLGITSMSGFKPSEPLLADLKQIPPFFTENTFEPLVYPQAKLITQGPKEYVAFEKPDFLELYKTRLKAESNFSVLSDTVLYTNTLITERNILLTIAQDIERKNHLYERRIFDLEENQKAREQIQAVKTWAERIAYILLLVVIR